MPAGGRGAAALCHSRQQAALHAAAPGNPARSRPMHPQMWCFHCLFLGLQVAGAQLCFVISGSGLHWAPEPGEPGAKLSLVGVDASNLPRTAASVPALQRTQLYAWARALGEMCYQGLFNRKCLQAGRNMNKSTERVWPSMGAPGSSYCSWARMRATCRSPPSPCRRCIARSCTHRRRPSVSAPRGVGEPDVSDHTC